VAAKYAAGVIRGGAEMLLQKDDTPDELIRAVCSPGGSTIEGIKHLEAENFTKTVRDTVMTSYNKTVLLGKNS
jgi:pyrroline-5-carboxylate reductase